MAAGLWLVSLMLPLLWFTITEEAHRIEDVLPDWVKAHGSS